MECKFLSCVYSVPQLIEIQHTFLIKHLKQSFTMCIVDDSVDESCSEEIQAICQRLTYEYIRCPPHLPNRQHPSGRHADALNYGWFTMKKGPYKYVGVLDNDILLSSPLDLDKELTSPFTCLGVRNTRGSIYYFWPGMFICSTEHHTVQTFNWDMIEEGSTYTDPGGATYYAWSDTELGVNAKEYVIIKPEYDSLGNWNERTWVSILQDKAPEFVVFCEKDINISKQYKINYWTDLLYTDTHSWFHLRGLSNWQNYPDEYIKERVNLLGTLFIS